MLPYQLLFNMKILRVKHTNLYDVFTGDGWHNHARVYFNKHPAKGEKCISFVGKATTKLTFSQIQSLQIKLILEK